MALSIKKILLIPCLFLSVAGCKKQPVQQQNVLPSATLKATAPFPIGAAVGSNPLQSNFVYQGILLSDYNSLTSDWEMKFAEVEPQQGQFNYTPGDYIVNFAAEHHMRMHGHNLIWHQALPDWVLSFKGDSLAWENLFKTHIESEAAHYKDQVASWDVVNEAIRDDNGQLRNVDSIPGDGSGSIWRQHLGPDYIARAFQYAHQADPNALLFYNDYGQEWGSVKLDAMISLVARLKKRGVPISGIGMQMHIDLNADTAKISSALRRLAATGLLVHVSELDISVNPTSNPNIAFTSALQLQQSALYQFIAESYRANVPAVQRFGITTWEFSDHDSWIMPTYNRRDWPLPFDSAYQKKPAYYGLLKGLKD